MKNRGGRGRGVKKKKKKKKGGGRGGVRTGEQQHVDNNSSMAHQPSPTWVFLVVF